MLVLLLVSALVARPIPTEAYALATAGIGVTSLIASLILWHDVQAHGPFQAIAKSIDVDGFACFGVVLVSCGDRSSPPSSRPGTSGEKRSRAVSTTCWR